jgi:predicted ATPase
MRQGFQPKFITTELDPKLLKSSFKVQTHWHVITGAACSGKTTLINKLAERGYKIVPEAGREFIKREGKKLITGKQHGNGATMTRVLTEILLRAESGLRASDMLFLDRAFADQISYYRIHGIDPNEILADCFRYRYASVFLLERFPFQPDGVRYEDEKTAAFLDEWHERDYRALGYDVVRVPAIPPAERAAFVIEKLKDLLLN